MTIDLTYKALQEDADEIAAKLGAKPAAPMTRTKIENVEAEAAVVNWLVKDIQHKEILRRLNDMYPTETFEEKDLKAFIDRHRNIMRAMIKADKKLMKRHLDVNFAFRDKLIEMQETAHEALKRAAVQEDYSAIASLQNSILKNIQLFAKLGGLLEQEGNKIEINISEQVASAIADENNAKKREFLEQARAIDVGYEILEDDEQAL